MIRLYACDKTITTTSSYYFEKYQMHDSKDSLAAHTANKFTLEAVVLKVNINQKFTISVDELRQIFTSSASLYLLRLKVLNQ